MSSSNSSSVLNNNSGSTGWEIPEGLGEMLRDFTISVLRERPTNLLEFAAKYFPQLHDAKLKVSMKPKSVQMYVMVDSDEESGEPDREHFKPKSQKNRFARRQSVSAERYDPEQDSEEDDIVVHPKSDIQRIRLTEAVKGILLFKSLDPEQMTNVIDAMFERKVVPNEDVIIQGDDGDNFYVIESGLYDVFVKSGEGDMKKVFTFENQGSFGELALMYNMPRSATVKASTPGTLWAMDRKSFRRIVLKSAFKKRKMYEQLLENVPILKTLSSYERMNLADAFLPKRYTDGETIIKEGDEADGMFFIEDGQVRVTITQHGEEKVVPSSQSLCKGGYFGEMALVENSPRTATVYSVGNIKLAYLDRGSFERLLGPCLDIMKRNMASYAKST